MRQQKRIDYASRIAVLLAVSCALTVPGSWVGLEASQNLQEERFQSRPADVSAHWKGLIGEYTRGIDTMCVLEHAGSLYLLTRPIHRYQLSANGVDTFAVVQEWPHEKKVCIFKRDRNENGISVNLGELTFTRVFYGEESGKSFRIRPLKPVRILRDDALKAAPPNEEGEFLEPDLTELTNLDSTFRLDIRYATTNNFIGEQFYSQARAFLQRPAAEALVRVHQSLRRLGYGLLIHDAYRPWYVTKMFWDATPVEQKEFVADPSKGSRHNRGCAVDLSLYDLSTGRAVAMVSGYDEFSHRAYPEYPGGTSLQRWHRQLLRHAMEVEGFTVFESEWWHFDYREWRRYPIGTTTFEMIR